MSELQWLRMRCEEGCAISAEDTLPLIDEVEQLRSELANVKGLAALNAKEKWFAVAARNNAEAEADRLREEIEILRSFGNKDCTVMADEELARRRSKG